MIDQLEKDRIWSDGKETALSGGSKEECRFVDERKEIWISGFEKGLKILSQIK